MPRPTARIFVLGSVDTFAINQTLYKKPLYNAADGFFVPIGLVTDQAMVLLARKDFPANDMKDFIAYAKANHAKMQFGSGGVGLRRASQLFLRAQCRHWRRGHPRHLSRLGAGDPGSVRRPARLLLRAGGRRRPVRSKASRPRGSRSSPAIARRCFPALRSAHEQGLTNFHADFWTGLFLPKGTPEPIVQKLSQALQETLNTPSVQERLLKIAVTVVPPERRRRPI